MLTPWKTAETRLLLDRPPFLKVEEHTVQLPNGRLIPDWTWVVTPNYINVVALTPNQRFILFRQTKYSVSGTTLAPVGGYIEPDEDPLTAAQRELREETGYEAPTWTFLATLAVDGNRGCGTAHFYLAQDAISVGTFASDDLEEQALLLLSRIETEQALDNGDFKVMPYAAIIALALRKLT